MKSEKELALLEAELVLLQDTIDRLRKFKEEHNEEEWKPWSSNIVGELKHRCIALKQRLTIVSGFSTREYFKK